MRHMPCGQIGQSHGQRVDLTQKVFILEGMKTFSLRV
jgi:hypothetical protein